MSPLYGTFRLTWGTLVVLTIYIKACALYRFLFWPLPLSHQKVSRHLSWQYLMTNPCKIDAVSLLPLRLWFLHHRLEYSWLFARSCHVFHRYREQVGACNMQYLCSAPEKYEPSVNQMKTSSYPPSLYCLLYKHLFLVCLALSLLEIILLLQISHVWTPFVKTVTSKYSRNQSSLLL